MDERWLTRTERRALSKARMNQRRAERRRDRIASDEAYALRLADRRRASDARCKARMKSDPEYAAQVRKKASIRRKLRREHDPGYDAMIRLRKRLSKVLCGEKKAGSCRLLVGCSPSELRDHLESRFLPGMSWDNRRQWHIDHIRPCAAFDLSDPDQQAKCFHYSNLQPLWASDNIRKGAAV